MPFETKVNRRIPAQAVAVLSLAALLFVIGCMAESSVIMYSQRFPPKPSTEPIQVFETARPPHEYIEIARIECGDTDDTYNMEQLMLKAREVGADALIIQGRTGAFGLATGSYLAVGVGQGHGLAAIAIKFK